VILGSAHPLSGLHKPHNSLYIINPDGQIIDRYDKRFCSGNPVDNTGDLAHYTAGNHFAIFKINGIQCSTLICYDYRFPELYRALKQQRVDLVFHSFHAGNMDAARKRMMEEQVGEAYHVLNPGKTLPEITIPATMISNAANNYLWISASNTSAQESCWGSFMVRPDGVIIRKLPKNEDELLITEIDLDHKYYDSTRLWRDRAMQGHFYSGELISDPKSEDRSIY